MELERCFFLDDAYRRLVGRRRGDHNRLGFGVQLATVRLLGTFLADPVDVPDDVGDCIAAQLDVAASCLTTYAEREKTGLEHQWEIAREYGYRDFLDVEAELVRWVDDLAWTTGEGPNAIFADAIGWLRERQVLLPGVTVLARLVARERDPATMRVWTELSQQGRALTLSSSEEIRNAHRTSLPVEVERSAAPTTPSRASPARR
jgi:hypothetical protein